jgi:hypothetical protein
MDRIICDGCGEEHDLSEIEPSYLWPDAYLDVPPDEREFRVRAGADAVLIRDLLDTERRYFLRVLLPFRVRGDESRYSWGVWVEISARDWARTDELWNDPEQGSEPPFPATLANSLKGYTGTLGLTGMVQLTGPKSVPDFTLLDTVQHPLAAEQHDGVYPERVVEWAAMHLH